MTLTSSTLSLTGAGGGASGSRLASSIAVGWPRQMGHRLAIRYGGVRGSSAEDQGDWGLVRQRTHGLLQLPGCLCRIVLPFFVKMNSDPAVVSVLLRGVLVCESRSWSSVHSRHFSCLPSWWSHVEIRHYVTSPLYLAVPVRCLGLPFVAQCLVRRWVHAMRQVLVFFWRVFFVKANSFSEVDSRPALLGPRSLEKCAQFLLRVALGCYTLKSEHYFHELRVFGSHCSLFQFCVRRVFSCVRHRRGGGVAGSLDSQVSRHQLRLRDCCIGITAVDKHTVEHASETTTTTTTTTTTATTTTTTTLRSHFASRPFDIATRQFRGAWACVHSHLGQASRFTSLRFVSAVPE